MIYPAQFSSKSFSPLRFCSCFSGFYSCFGSTLSKHFSAGLSKLSVELQLDFVVGHAPGFAATLRLGDGAHQEAEGLVALEGPLQGLRIGIACN